MTFESPSSVRPLYAKVSGYVSVPPSYAETDTPETSDDGKTWQLSITSDQSLDFGAGLEMFDIKGIMSRKTDGTLNTRIWTASTVTDPIVFVPQLFELRTYVMSSEITAYPPTGPDICVPEVNQWPLFTPKQCFPAPPPANGGVTFSFQGSGVANSALCAVGGIMSDIEMEFEYSETDGLVLDATCPMEIVFAQDAIPSIKSITINEVAVRASGMSSGTAKIGADAHFGLSTKSPAGSVALDCDARPLWQSQSTHSQCITARASASFEKSAPDVYMATFSLESTGAWVHPLELRNFAVVNANFDASVALHGGKLKLFGVGWKDVLIFYKKPALAAWPSAIIGKGTKEGLDTTGLSALRASPEIVEIKTSFLYAPFPHGDEELPDGYPRFAIGIDLKKLDILSILTMYYDAQMSIFTLLTGVDTPAAPSLFSAVDTAWLEVITFDGSGDVSLVNSDRWSRGVNIDATAAVAATFAGIQMSLRLKVAYSPPSDEISQRDFCHNPIGTAILNGAIELTASGTKLPFGIGTADFVVSVSPSGWSLYASGKLMVGPFALDIDIVKSPEGVLAASASGKLGPFGPVAFSGELDASKPISWSSPFLFTPVEGFPVSGSIIVAADVGATSLTGKLSASASLGTLGNVAFTGSISSDGSYAMTGTSDLDPAALLTKLASTLATAVLGSAENIVTRNIEPLISALPISITEVSATYGGTVGSSFTERTTPTMSMGLELEIDSRTPKKLSFNMCTSFITPAEMISCLASMDDLSTQALKLLAPLEVKLPKFSLSLGGHSFRFPIPKIPGVSNGPVTLSTPGFSASATITVLLTETSLKLKGSFEIQASAGEAINIAGITFGIPAFSKKFTGLLSVNKEELTSSFKISLCEVFPDIKRKQFCTQQRTIQLVPKNCLPEVCAPAFLGGKCSQECTPAVKFTFRKQCFDLTDVVQCSRLVISA